MLASVFTKSIRDRWIPALVGALAVAVFFWFGAAVYRDVDTSFYYEFPRVWLDLIGLPEQGGVAGIAFGAIFNLIGAFVLAGIAIGIGASSIAGEEADGTFGLLLANPLSRRAVLIDKAISLVVVIGAMTLLLWGSGYVVPRMLNIDMSGIHVEALLLGLFLNALAHGFIAMAVGAWTGSRSAASSTTVGLMVVGYLAAGLLPLVGGIEWLTRVFPWWYFSGTSPVSNGVDILHTSVLIAISVVSFAIAYVGIVRRDLRDKSTAVTIVDRLRANPRTQKVMDRIAGSARVSRISIKATSEHQGLLTITSAVMFYMGLFIPLFYNFIPDDFINVVAQFPDAMIAMIGGVDMSTSSGFVTGEIFSLAGPVALLSLTIIMGARALAGEEEKHTMGLLLANPISKSHVIFEKAIAMLIYGVLFGVVTFTGTWIGVLIAGSDISVSGIVAVTFMLVLLGWVFGALALAVGAATGRSRFAALVATAVAVASFFIFSFFPLSASFEPWAVISPFKHYLGNDPMLNGIAWSNVVVLISISVVLVAAALPLFERRDLRG